MIDVLMTPADLSESFRLERCQVVVLDVLRATSTITAALQAGARGIRLFDSLDAARRAKAAAADAPEPILLVGEERCLKPDDFDLGNSPREQVTHRVGGATLFLATTNGTRAAVRAAAAAQLFAGSLLNAAATATALLRNIDSLDTILLCSGTAGKPSLEDTLGAGAILFSLLGATYRTDLGFTDNAWLAYHAFTAVHQRLPAALRLGQGGINIIDAGLEDDIEFCARLNAIPLTATINSLLHVKRAE